MTSYCSTCFKAVFETEDRLRLGNDRFFHIDCVTCSHENCSLVGASYKHSQSDDGEESIDVPTFWMLDDSWLCDSCYDQLTPSCFACRKNIQKNSKYIEFDSWASNNFKPDSDQNGQSATDKTMTSFADTISVDSTTSIPLRKSTLQFHLDCFKCSVGRCTNRWISTCADNFYINYKDCTLICTACMKFYKNLTSEAQKRYSRSLDRKPSLFGKRPNPVYIAKKSDRTDTMRVERE